MTAIDFRKLLKEAKKEAQQPSKQQPPPKDDEEKPTNIGLEIKRDRPSHWPSTTTTPVVDWDSQHDAHLQFQQQLRTPVSFSLPVSSTDTQPTVIYSSIQYYPPLSTDDDGSTMDLQPLAQWLQSLPHGDSGQGEWKTMTYGKRKVCMFDGTTAATNSSTTDGGSSSSSSDTHHDKKDVSSSESLATAELSYSSLLPPPLSILADQLVQAGIFPTDTPPNHVLLNEYQPGQGIDPHTDGPAYEAMTATLSLKSSVLLEFTPRWKSYCGPPHCSSSSSTLPPGGGEGCSVWLEAGSWIVFSKGAYIDYCHGIAFSHYDVLDDHPDCLNAPAASTTTARTAPAATSQLVGPCLPRQHRYSLTFRHKKNTMTT